MKSKHIFILGIFVFSLFLQWGITFLLKKRSNPVIVSQDNFQSETISNYVVISETPIPTPTKKPTPTFTPTLTPRPTLSPSSLDAFFITYANRYSIDSDRLKRIAFCESRFNSNAINGIYGGLFQFSVSSWRATRVRMGENQQPELRFNSEEAIKTAAFKIARDGVGAWPNCGK